MVPLSTVDRLFEAKKIRLAFLLVAGVAFVITEFGRFVCRPYVRKHGINDFGITDSIGNAGGIIVICFLGIAVINPSPKKGYALALFYTLGFVAYEFAQPHLPKGTFDWNDVYGTFIGFLITLPILWGLRRAMPEKAEDPEGN